MGSISSCVELVCFLSVSVWDISAGVPLVCNQHQSLIPNLMVRF